MTDNPKNPEPVWDPQVELEHWKAEYEAIKENEGSQELELNRQAPSDESSDQDRRIQPRYSFNQGAEIFAHLGPRAFQIINISVSGCAFYSDTRFLPGTQLLLSALGLIALEVEVMDCELEEVDADMMEYRYKVRAKFLPNVNGYQVYVLAREMYLKQVSEQKNAQ